MKNFLCKIIHDIIKIYLNYGEFACMKIKKIDSYIEDICKYNNFSKNKTEEIKYVMNVMVLETIKMLTIISLYSFFGYTKEILLIVLVMVAIKPFTGGYHEDSQKKCFIYTLFLCLLIIILYKTSYLSIYSIIVLHLINIFSVYNQAPIINVKMPLTRLDLINKNRIVSVFNSLIFFLISLVFYNEKVYSNIITWTIIINTCLMFNKNKED